MKRIYLSPPHAEGREEAYLLEAFRSNWIAPVGPDLQAFEDAFSEHLGGLPTVALSSGTAALHLALKLLGLSPGDEVFCSDLTFVASANPILYEGGVPVFIDSEEISWNMDPRILAAALDDRARKGRLPRAVIAADLYGQCPELPAIEKLCASYEVPLIEDAAEALGATCFGQPAGTFGHYGIFSFNGNKIITTSGGGLLAGAESEAIARARHLATQAREPARHYEHVDCGYNYRMSNLCAAVGRGQLADLPVKVERRRAIFDRYVAELGDLPGVSFMPEAPWGRCTRWLTCLTLDPATCPLCPAAILDALEAENIEARPVWKPMHLQPLYQDAETWGGAVAERLFETGLCLPSGSGMSAEDQERVIRAFRRCFPT